jgi:hypothetical protein
VVQYKLQAELESVSPTLKESRISPNPPSRQRTRRVKHVLLLAAALGIGGILLEGALVHLPGNTLGTPAAGERLGAVHIHTVASDGSGTIPEVIAAARKANLSFMAVTDHNVAVNESALAEDPPDFPILPGEELTTSRGHFVTLGIPPGWQKPHTDDAETLLAAAHAAGGFNILAHPFSNKIPWTDWKTADYDGLEIWNEDENWRRNSIPALLSSLLVYTINDQLAMVRLARTPDANFAKWDELLAQRPMVGMCGTDAHAELRLGHGMFLRFPGYVPVFLVAREHVLLGPEVGGGDANHANAAEILTALERGHSFCSLDALFPASGFVSRVSTGNASGGPGDFLNWANQGSIHISVPSGSSQPLIEEFRDGHEIIEKQGWTLDAPLPGPGRYRTEVFLRQPGVLGWRRWTLWIFSNPTYVTASSGAGQQTGSLSSRSLPVHPLTPR